MNTELRLSALMQLNKEFNSLRTSLDGVLLQSALVKRSPMENLETISWVQSLVTHLTNIAASQDSEHSSTPQDQST